MVHAVHHAVGVDVIPEGPVGGDSGVFLAEAAGGEIPGIGETGGGVLRGDPAVVGFKILLQAVSHSLVNLSYVSKEAN